MNCTTRKKLHLAITISVDSLGMHGMTVYMLHLVLSTHMYSMLQIIPTTAGEKQSNDVRVSVLLISQLIWVNSNNEDSS